jgi:hypothetical protein
MSELKLTINREKESLCKYCGATDPIEFRPSNKSACKLCISAKDKIERGTALNTDPVVIRYCRIRRIELSSLPSRRSERKASTVQDNKTQDVGREDLSQRLALLEEKIERLTLENVELTKLVYNERDMMGKWAEEYKAYLEKIYGKKSPPRKSPPRQNLQPPVGSSVQNTYKSQNLPLPVPKPSSPVPHTFPLPVPTPQALPLGSLNTLPLSTQTSGIGLPNQPGSFGLPPPIKRLGLP